MSNKGKTFTFDDLPARCKWSSERKQAWCDEMTEKFKIVAMDNGSPVIAEEVDECILIRLGEVARPMARMLLNMPIENRRRVLGAFDADGELINPLEPYEAHQA